MKIYIRSSNINLELELELPPSSSIKTVKEKIMQACGVPIDKQILMLGSKIFKDINKTLMDYHVRDNARIRMYLYDDNIIGGGGFEKKVNIIPIYNPKLNLLPTIILCVDYDCTINEDLYNNLKKELSEIIDEKNFSIIELRKGSIIMKLILIGELALKGIKASQFNQTSEEINFILKKIESKKFVCLGNNYSSNTSYKIPNYSEN